MMISKSIVVVIALAGLALPTAGVGGGAILQPAAAADEGEDEFSLGDILDFALGLVDLDITQDGGGGGGDEDGANISQQDSTQERNNRNVDSQGNVQRQSRTVTDGSGDGCTGPGCGGSNPD